MNKLLLFSMILVFLASSLLLPLSCKRSTLPTHWQNLREDDDWVQNLNQYLELSYVEQEDRAAFTLISPRSLSPSLYTTYAVFTLLGSLGATIENQAQIIDHIDSLRNQHGAYVDSFAFFHFNPPNETRQAITILTELEVRPEHIDSTVNYLLSLQYDDGTFLLDPQEEITDRESTIIRRISRGTHSVVDSLIKLGFKDKIPDETINVLMSEVASRLGDHDSFPSLMENDTWKIAVAIELLAKIDPALVTKRAKDFIAYALEEIVNMPPDAYVFTSRANRLLDIAHLLQLPEIEEEAILEGIRVYLKEKIFPYQNLTGGFGPSGTIEPLTTSLNVILANRLGVEYPNLDKLILEIEKHWLGNGWAAFIIYTIGSDDYKPTYYAIEIAEFSGYNNYNKEKVGRFLRECLAGDTVSVSNEVELEDLYYVVKALKTMNGGLSEEDKQSIQELCLILARSLANVSGANVNDQFSYILPISKEAGFELPEEVKADILRLAMQYKENTLVNEEITRPQPLFDLWVSLEEEDAILTKDEVTEYLNTLYDEDSGGYTSLALAETTTAQQQTVSYTPHPEIFQTYLALQLLSDIDESLPDKNKTLSFVFDCKQEYGFKKGLDWQNPHISATFAALMILKQL